MGLSEARQCFLITPMQPTPNGLMHIGHGGGTYLRADIWARALRVRGHSAVVICGSDAYENWIVPEARRIGMEPGEACSFYHKANRADLSLLGIDFDAWINPLDPKYSEEYIALHERVFSALRDAGGAVTEMEKIPFMDDDGEPVVGAWLIGRCPHCGADAQGSSCVKCGFHFQPEEIIDPRSRLDDRPVRWRPQENWFVRPRDISAIAAKIQSAFLGTQVLAAAEGYLREAGGRIRMSGPASWGIHSHLLSLQQVLANPYFLYSVYCGEVYRAEGLAKQNPFEPGSNVRTLGVFGSDNTVPGVVAPHVFAQAIPERIVAFDSVIVNGMLNFEGRKCSTSKRHGIWLGELLRNTSITADELRWALAGIPLDDGAADLTLDGLVSSINVLRRQTARLSGFLDAMAGREVRWNSGLERGWAAGSGYEPGSTPVTTMVAELESAIKMTDQNPDPAAMLFLCLITAPVIPGFASEIWRRLGLSSTPSIDAARGAAGRVRAEGKTAEPTARAGNLKVAELLAHVHRAA
jgi:methionyl-tRNA synthetase